MRNNPLKTKITKEGKGGGAPAAKTGGGEPMEEQVFPCSLWRMWKHVDPVVHRGPILEEFVKDYSLWKEPLLRMKKQHTGHSHHSPPPLPLGRS